MATPTSMIAPPVSSCTEGSVPKTEKPNTNVSGGVTKEASTVVLAATW